MDSIIADASPQPSERRAEPGARVRVWGWGHNTEATLAKSSTFRAHGSCTGVAFFSVFSRILKECNVTQKLERASPQKLAQSNLHRKAVSKRFSKVKNFEFEFPTVFRLHNDIFKFSNFENRFFERRIPQRTDQVPWSYSGLA